MEGETTMNEKMRSFYSVTICLGLILVAFMVATALGFFRVHIENLSTRTVWIFNAPSEESATYSPNEVRCLAEKKCEVLKDGTIKILENTGGKNDK